MKCWIVIARIYGENSWVRGVFSTPEAAEAAKDRLKEPEHNEMRVEEWEIENPVVAFEPAGQISAYGENPPGGPLWITEAKNGWISISSITASGWDNVTSDELLDVAEAEKLRDALTAAIQMAKK